MKVRVFGKNVWKAIIEAMEYLMQSADVAQRAGELLGSKFFSGDLAEDFRRKIIHESSLSARDVALGEAIKASRPYLFYEGGQLLGASEVSIYAWERLKKQLIMQKDDNDIWLSQMGVQLPEVKGLAIELAYFEIEEEFRGKGFGTRIFNQSLRNCLQEVGDQAGCLFTIAMGEYASTGMGQKVKHHLLMVERERNGTNSDGLIAVTGVKVPLAEVEEQFQIDRQKMKVRSESAGTEAIVRKGGWKYLGLANNLSPIYGTTNLNQFVAS